MQGRGASGSTAMQAPSNGPGFGPRPPYHPGMQQGCWQQQQPQSQQGNLQRPFFAAQNGFPQQYALVPLNSNGGMMPGPQQHGANSMTASPGFGMGGPAFMNGFNIPQNMGAPPFAGPPGGGRGMGPRPPPGQPPSQGRGGARGRGAGRGPPTGRGGRGASQGRGRAFAGLRVGPAPPSSGMTKDQRRNAKAMAKLDKQVQEEKPRVYKPLGEEERLEAARWQAERRKHYPTAANMSLKAEAAVQRQARGELEPEAALRHKRLQEVLIRQRELGLQQIAGTADMPIHGQPNTQMTAGFPNRGRSGRGGRFGRAGGRAGASGRGPGRAFGRGPDFKRPLDEDMANGQQASKRHKSANEAAVNGHSGALASLAQYGSDDDNDGDHAEAAASNNAPQGGVDSEAGVRAPPAGAGPPPSQTPEEKQALYLKHKAQIERQQQQHQDKMERRKKAQEEWQERRGRGRGRGRGVAGRGQGGRHADRSGATQQAQRKPTLLQKLLVKDIRTDHSHILQCFRFFVNNNFLQDVGSKPVVYPDPPPTLRQALPPAQDDDDSLASGSENDTAGLHVNGQEQAHSQEEDTESSGDSEEESGDEEV